MGLQPQKHMKIAEIAIERPVGTVMFVLILIVFGVLGYRNIGLDFYPDVDIPYVTVMTQYIGASPESVETDVTEKIEEAVSTISGIKTIRSNSYEGMSIVVIEFELSENVDIVSQDVRDKVAKARGELPDDIEEPIIERLDVTAVPVMYVALTSTSDSLPALSTYVEETAKKRIESVQGVGKIRIIGQQERNVRFWLKADKLKQYNISANDILAAITQDNREPPGGRVETGNNEIILKTMGKLLDVDDFRNLILTQRNGHQIVLSDVAEIGDDTDTVRSWTQWNGRPAVALEIQKQGGRNTVRVANEVKKRVEQLRKELPDGYQIDIVDDLSEFVQTSVEEANGELVRGAILTVLVIYFFLQTIRGSFVAAVVIPASIIGTYAFIHTLGFTLNMMSLLGLTVSVGLVVDDAIVVLENAYRHIEEGLSPLAAAYAAMREIGFAVIAVSAATLSVFLPVGMMGGIVGRFFMQFAVTVSVAITISTVLAITLSPMMCSRMLSKSTKRKSILFRLIDSLLDWIERVYGIALHAAMRVRWLVLFGAFLVFCSSGLVLPFVGQEFVPKSDESQFVVNFKAPVGTSLEESEAIAQEISRRMRLIGPDVTDIFATVGGNDQGEVNRGAVRVKLTKKAHRIQKLTQFDYERLARTALTDMMKKDQGDRAGLEVSITAVPRMGGGGNRAPVQIIICGGEQKALATSARKLLDRFTQVPGIVDLASSYDDGKPEINIIIDREKAYKLGVTPTELGFNIMGMVGGRKISTYEDPSKGKTYDIRMRLLNDDRNSVETIRTLPIKTASGKTVELQTFADVVERLGPVQIDREDRERQVTIFMDVNRSVTDLKSANDACVAITREPEMLGEGMRLKLGGEADRMKESFGYMFTTLILAVLLIYMVLAIQFESLAHPFTVMLSLPLSVVGALGLLAITGKSLSIFSMIGVIMLMGLVTKNAILLIDYANQLRRDGVSCRDAILRAGPVRLRPILMTAIATIAGMIPVLIGAGDGGETRSPMGAAIIGGMVTSTILTLIVIPVVYTIVDDNVRNVAWFFGFKTDPLDYEAAKKAAQSEHEA
ncbi:MAG: efflux RND transporter permease subunit [Thermoguttaceae bacterium]